MNISCKQYEFATNEQLTDAFYKEYAVRQKPIAVSFRKLFPELNNMERFSHLIHTYPAKLLVHIPYFFLNNALFSKEGDTILDPFCGTGTVLLEANIAGRNAFGADANPLARKIAIVKTQPLNDNKLKTLLLSILNRAKQLSITDLPNVRNRDFWFPRNTQIQLAQLLNSIDAISDDKYRLFFEVCLSNCVKKVSYADPRIAVPVKLNPQRFDGNTDRYKNVCKRLMELENIDVFEKFKAICDENIVRIKKSSTISKNTHSEVISKDARFLTKSLTTKERLEDNSVDMILTSPPYAGAQKYIRSSSLNLGWLRLTEKEDLKCLDKQSIGRENYLVSELKEIKTGISSADILLEKLYHQHKLRAHIVGNYLLEMKDAINESIRVLKRGGYFVIVIGNNKVCDYEFNTQEYLTEYIESRGLVLQFKLIDDIKSYGLMTKRNKTADIISREWILVFKKP
jgi:DNA modification methylase